MTTTSISKVEIITTEQLIHHIIKSNQEKNRFCFILGAGASVESGIPSGIELEHIWMRFLMGIESDPYDDISTTKTQIETIKTADELKNSNRMQYAFSDIISAWNEWNNKQIDMPSKYFLDVYKLRFYPNLSRGYKYFEQMMKQHTPSKGYHALSLLLAEKSNLNNLVITTNFDSLLEDALSSYSIDPDRFPTIVSQESIAGFNILDVQHPTICKVNRKLYYDLVNIQEVKDYLSDEWKNVLRTIFPAYTPIVIGCGGGDTSLMSFLEDKNTIMPNGIYWCSLDPEAISNKQILNILKEKHGKLVHIEGFDNFMLELGNQL